MKYAAFCFVVFWAGTLPAVAGMLTPSEVGQSVRTNGARETVRLLNQRKQFDAVLEYVAAGNTAWIGLVPALSKGTDAGNSDGLVIALALALPRNPRAVLAVLDDGPTINTHAVRGLPFIEPSIRKPASTSHTRYPQ
jgi:hypothetical protein